jgi:hypothetical protein
LGVNLTGLGAGANPDVGQSNESIAEIEKDVGSKYQDGLSLQGWVVVQVQGGATPINCTECEEILLLLVALVFLLRSKFVKKQG